MPEAAAVTGIQFVDSFYQHLSGLGSLDVAPAARHVRAHVAGMQQADRDTARRQVDRQ